MLVIVVWDLKEEEGKAHGDVKSNVDKQMLAELCSDNGT